jgi:hypothetical protein
MAKRPPPTRTQRIDQLRRRLNALVALPTWEDAEIVVVLRGVLDLLEDA